MKELPSWLVTRLMLVPPLVPIVMGIGNEVGWWSPTTTLVSLIDTLAVGLLALILGKRVTEAETAIAQEWKQAELEELDLAKYDSGHLN